jgi:D-sedoheptulose 7-phosphate isomerase
MPPPPFSAIVRQRILDSISVKNNLLSDSTYVEAVARAATAIVQAIQKGNKVLFFGNGGSAADAQHLAAELTGRYLKERPALPALTLTANTSALTAIANDYSYDLVFSRQLQALGNKGDVAFGITTSGNSQNVIKAMEMAAVQGLVTVGLTGATGGRLRTAVTHCLCVPSTDTPRIQECHILTGHILCEIIESQCCGESDPA